LEQNLQGEPPNPLCRLHHIKKQTTELNHRVDAKHWINILNDFFDLSAVKISPRSVLGNIQTNLKALGLEDTPEFVCQVFLLTNINFVTAQHGLERLLCERGDVADPTAKCLQFLARSADNAFNVLDTTAIFCQLMNECTVHSAKLDKQMQFANIREEVKISQKFYVL